MQFNIDLNRLQKSYRIIQAEIHPDKFISASEIEKKQSLIKSTEVNDAYQTLKNPIKRAKYLIKINLNVIFINIPPVYFFCFCNLCAR